MKKNANKGFSLVELIIVIAIMAVLVGVLAGQFIPKIEQSRQSADLTSVQELKEAIEVYASDNDITAPVTITIAGGSTKTATVNLAAAVTDAGLKATSGLKSAGWSNGVYTYDNNAMTWAVTTSVGTNSKAGAKALNMDSVFTSGS